jgi:hypothetical protein
VTRRVLIVIALSFAPASGFAQNADPAVHRIEMAVAVGVAGGSTLGASDANLRARDATEYRLFTTSSRFAASRLAEARIGFGLTRRYAIEGRLGFSQPELRTKVTGDVEGAPDVTLAERIDHYLIEGALIVMLDAIRVGGFVPFSAVGAGYLRQVHEGQTLIEEGTAYHVGGGVKRRLVARDRGLIKAAGLRGDVRLYLFAGGVELESGPRPHVAASGSLFVTF